jgi:hypothetical protein
MHRDEIVEEVRRIREEYVARLDYDFDKIFKDLKEGEQRSGHTIVSPPPKRAVTVPEH